MRQDSVVEETCKASRLPVSFPRAPQSPVRGSGAPGGHGDGNQPPPALTGKRAGPGEEEHRLDHLAARDLPRRSPPSGRVEEISDERPLRVRQLVDRGHRRKRATRLRQVLWHESATSNGNIRTQGLSPTRAIAPRGHRGTGWRETHQRQRPWFSRPTPSMRPRHLTASRR